MASKFEAEILKYVDESYVKDPHARIAMQLLPDKVFPPILQDIKMGRVVYPTHDLVLRVFKETPLHKVRVVILGQDPYHDGSAIGRAFDNMVSKAVMSPSLKAILKEIDADVGKTDPSTSTYLGHLPGQGVLLLNTALTVIKEVPGSHTKYWKPFTENMIQAIDKQDFIVWMLWGRHAQKFERFITNKRSFVIKGFHPSPLAGGKFYGGKYFSKANQYMNSHGLLPINW